MALTRRNGICKMRVSGSGEDYMPYSKVTSKIDLVSVLLLSGTGGIGRLYFLFYVFPLLIIHVEDRIVLKEVFQFCIGGMVSF
jgi:hypothetical protein